MYNHDTVFFGNGDNCRTNLRIAALRNHVNHYLSIHLFKAGVWAACTIVWIGAAIQRAGHVNGPLTLHIARICEMRRLFIILSYVSAIFVVFLLEHMSIGTLTGLTILYTLPAHLSVTRSSSYCRSVHFHEARCPSSSVAGVFAEAVGLRGIRRPKVREISISYAPHALTCDSTSSRSMRHTHSPMYAPPATCRFT